MRHTLVTTSVSYRRIMFRPYLTVYNAMPPSHGPLWLHPIAAGGVVEPTQCEPGQITPVLDIGAATLEHLRHAVQQT